MAGQLNPGIKIKFWSKFTGWCHQAVVLGYHEIRKKSIDYKEWEEEDISAALFIEMERLTLVKSKKISITPEFRNYNNAIATGKIKAKNADRIDFRFTKWKSKDEKKYYGEAKNISLSAWKKAVGTEVNASRYRARYIETGIDRVAFGKYSVFNCFLIGYVVNGSAIDNIARLNSLIMKRGLPPQIGLIENPKSICSYPECYVSKNIKDGKEVILQHIFLEFDS